MIIEFILNNAPVRMETDGGLRVLDLLREHAGLTGTKEGCGTGECGTCAIHVDGVTRLSCLMVAGQLNGKRVTTIEELPENCAQPLQQAFSDKGAVQCGYCTPGMIMTAAELLSKEPNPDRDRIRHALSGNLCRCTGYHKIVDAVAHASEIMQEKNQ
jgi:aerobic carbon-monoxide dehydrogenase small subunit